MSTDNKNTFDIPQDPEDVEIFDELYEEFGEAYEELAASDNPAAPLAQVIVNETSYTKGRPYDD